MIKTEETADGRIRHYSSVGKYIKQEETGIIYEDAVDYIPCPYTYTETNKKIPVVETED